VHHELRGLEEHRGAGDEERGAGGARRRDQRARSPARGRRREPEREERGDQGHGGVVLEGRGERGGRRRAGEHARGGAADVARGQGERHRRRRRGWRVVHPVMVLAHEHVRGAE